MENMENTELLAENSLQQTTLAKILLIDIDNCSNEIASVVKNLKSYSKIVICYGEQPPKVSLDFIYDFAEAIYEKKLDVLKMQKKGKNAADFGLCFLAGRLSVQFNHAEFVILSNDTDLDHAVHLLTTFNHNAQRIGTIENKTPPVQLLPVISEEVPKIEPDVIQVAQEYYAHTLKPAKARPATKEKLLNSIRAFCKNKCPDKEQFIFDYLHKKKYFLVLAETGKLEYCP